MTFLEKAKKEGKVNNERDFINMACPFHFGYERAIDYDCRGKCVEHWNSKMPNTETKQKVANPPTQEILDFIHENIEVIPVAEPQVAITKDDLELEYNKGLNDAWELAKKCVLLDGRGEDNELMMEIFGTVFLDKLFNNNTYQEALAKLKAYEEAQKIEVGDVLELMGNYCVVTGVDEDEKEFIVLWNSGNVNDVPFNAPASFKKTGKHIDIQSILDQIRGE